MRHRASHPIQPHCPLILWDHDPPVAREPKSPPYPVARRPVSRPKSPSHDPFEGWNGTIFGEKKVTITVEAPKVYRDTVGKCDGYGIDCVFVEGGPGVYRVGGMGHMIYDPWEGHEDRVDCPAPVRYGTAVRVFVALALALPAILSCSDGVTQTDVGTPDVGSDAGAEPDAGGNPVCSPAGSVDQGAGLFPAGAVASASIRRPLADVEIRSVTLSTSAADQCAVSRGRSLTLLLCNRLAGSSSVVPREPQCDAGRGAAALVEQNGRDVSGATGGMVFIDDASDACVAGRFDLDFPEGKITGSFTALDCP